MIDALVAAGKIAPGKGVLVEPTSGNTGTRPSLDSGDAGIDVDRAAQDAGTARRRTGTDPCRARHARRHRQGQ
jgi:hypothetical protein